MHTIFLAIALATAISGDPSARRFHSDPMHGLDGITLSAEPSVLDWSALRLEPGSLAIGTSVGDVDLAFGASALTDDVLDVPAAQSPWTEPDFRAGVTLSVQW